MSIIIVRRTISLRRLQQCYGDVAMIDVTSRGSDEWIRFSPFYPHGHIPVPFTNGYESLTVEGIWQGLKVFERADVDASKFTISTMKGIKRSTRVFGSVLGHREGLYGTRLLSYREARHAIYVLSYRWVLDHNLSALVEELARLSSRGTVLLLDYETNDNVDDLSRPLSHASLIRSYIEGREGK